ncbi:hypothetical protein QBC45DRAFT_318533, partial [Copromyces sp. CBS 386.78]
RSSNGERDKEGEKRTKKRNRIAPAANRTRGPSMATMDFTTKPLALNKIS